MAYHLPILRKTPVGLSPFPILSRLVLIFDIKLYGFFKNIYIMYYNDDKPRKKKFRR